MIKRMLYKSIDKDLRKFNAKIEIFSDRQAELLLTNDGSYSSEEFRSRVETLLRKVRIYQRLYVPKKFRPDWKVES